LPIFGPLGPDTFEQHGGRLVAAAFAAGHLGLRRHQLAAERLGQDRLRQLLGPRRGRRYTGFDGRGQPEQALDSTDDFALLCEGR
jgi:hypothetical protein